jgi:hypothetical protein
MVSVFIVIASMSPRTTNLRLEAISRCGCCRAS